MSLFSLIRFIPFCIINKRACAFYTVWIQIFIPSLVEADLFFSNQMKPEGFVCDSVLIERTRENVICGSTNRRCWFLLRLEEVNFFNERFFEFNTGFVTEGYKPILFGTVFGEKVANKNVEQITEGDKKNGANGYGWIAYFYHGLFCILLGWFLRDIHLMIKRMKY